MVQLHTHSVHQGEVETAEFAVGILAEIVGLAALDRASPTSGEDDGELTRVVGVAVHEAAREDDHAVVEKGALAFVRCRHFLEELGPEFHLELIHLLIVCETGLVAGVVGELVDARGDSLEAGETHVREIVVQHEGRDTGAVHLEGEEEDVEHEPQVIL